MLKAKNQFSKKGFPINRYGDRFLDDFEQKFVFLITIKLS
ncbi:hypothetical protein NIES2107_43710 [Nostoc carneum NIES-2107]|nr:hypothetical protein NIES2107_43710 [Nostoc carneum NIES-2107]